VKAFPDLTQEVTNLVAVGESAFAEAIARGTHTGPLETPDGEVPPTGRRIEVRFCVVARARDGLLVDGAGVLRLDDTADAARAGARVFRNSRLSDREDFLTHSTSRCSKRR
jgi:predicted ester cyclase